MQTKIPEGFIVPDSELFLLAEKKSSFIQNEMQKHFAEKNYIDYIRNLCNYYTYVKKNMKLYILPWNKDSEKVVLTLSFSSNLKYSNENRFVILINKK